MLGRFGVMLLAVEVKMDCASPIGDQAVIDVPRYPASRGAKQSDISSQMSTSSPSPSGSSSKDGWSFFPTSTMHDVQFMATEPTGHRFEQDHDFIATPDALLPSMSGYDAFDRDWLYELDIPKFTEDTNFIYPEPQELSIPAQSPVDQTTTKSTHKFSALALGSSRNTIDTLVASDFHDPTNSETSHSQRGNFQGQLEAGEYNDQEQFLQQVLAPKSSIKKLKKLGQGKFSVISHPQESLEARYRSDSRITEHLARGPSRHERGTNLLAENRGHLSYQSAQSSKRRAPIRKSEKKKKKKRPDKQGVSSDLKVRVLDHFKKRMENAESELAAYAQVLKYQESQPIALLTDRNLRSCKELQYLLNPNAKNIQGIDESELRWKYIENYQPSFSPLLQSPDQTDSQVIYSRKKRFSHLNYLMGRRYLWSRELNLGETIISLEAKWLNHILENVPATGRNPESALSSVYECTVISTTNLLYQIGVLFRLSNPLGEKIKPEITKKMEKVLDDVDKLWMNFPFNGYTLLNEPQSDDFWSLKMVDEITRARNNPGSIPVEIRVAKILLCQWLLNENPFISLKIEEDKRAISEFYQIIQDYAWLDYFLMQN